MSKSSLLNQFMACTQYHAVLSVILTRT